MRVLWEISHYSLTFRELQDKCDKISSSVLNTRLTELKEAELITLGEQGYELTEIGHELMELISPLRKWSEKWASALRS